MKNRQSILLFMTYGMNLQKWKEMGILDRELTLYNGFVDKGFDVKIVSFTSEDENDLVNSGITVIPYYKFVPNFNNKILNLLMSFFSWFYLRKSFHNYDIIKTNQMGGSWCCYLFKLIDRKPFVVRCGFELLWNHYRESTGFVKKYLVSAFFYLIEFFSYLFADKIVLTNESSKEFVLKMFLFVKSSKIVIIRNFVDPNIFKSLIDIQDRKNEFIFVGRLNKIKNLDLFLSFLPPDIPLNIVGEGEEKSRLIQISKDRNLKVNFLGRLDNESLPKIFNEYKFFVLPSRFENAPKALQEAMSCGCVVFGNDTFGINELIKNDVNGILFDVNNDSIESIFNRLTTDKARLLELSNTARMFAEKEFLLHGVIEKESSLYREILNSR